MAVTELSDEVSEASGQKGEQEIVGVKLRYIELYKEEFDPGSG